MTWHGKRAALSLTFDDGLKSQVENALPILNARRVPATFFLIKQSPFGAFDKDAWLAALAHGHEIGSHSVTHRKAATLSEQEAYDECYFSAEWLDKELGIVTESFCYPFTDCPPHLQEAARACYLQARAGRTARGDKYCVKGDGLNLYAVPAFHVSEKGYREQFPRILDEAVRRGAWITLMFHGVGEENDWDNITTQTFERMLDDIAARDIAVMTFADAAEEYRREQ